MGVVAYEQINADRILCPSNYILVGIDNQNTNGHDLCSSIIININQLYMHIYIYT